MKRLFILIATLYFSQHLAYAQADVYLCVDENGKKEYKNNGAVKGCKKVELQGITIVPAIAAPASSAPKKAASSPSDFPKVDEGTQKSRDSDRKQILQDELKSEEAKLANLKKEYNNGEPERRGDERNFAKYQERVANMKEEIGRSEKNIEALKREISNVK